MTNDTNLQGTAALLAGNKAEAAKLFSRVVMSEPENITAWLHLADCLDNPEKKKECLAWVLNLEPGNAEASARLANLSVQHPAPVAAANPEQDVHKLPEWQSGTSLSEKKLPATILCWACGKANPEDYTYCAYCRAVIKHGPPPPIIAGTREPKKTPLPPEPSPLYPGGQIKARPSQPDKPPTPLPENPPPAPVKPAPQIARPSQPDKPATPLPEIPPTATPPAPVKPAPQQATKICPYCSSPVLPGQKFCSSCGKSLIEKPYRPLEKDGGAVEPRVPPQIVKTPEKPKSAGRPFFHIIDLGFLLVEGSVFFMPWAYYQHSSFLGPLLNDSMMWTGYWLMKNGNGSSQLNVTVTLVVVLSLAGYILCRANVKWLAIIVTIGAIIAHINNFSALNAGANGSSGGMFFESVSVTMQSGVYFAAAGLAILLIGELFYHK